MSSDLHSALKTTIVADFSEGGVHYKHVRLQHGKDSFTDTLHTCPNSWSTAGFQTTDFLHYLGFRRSQCAFHVGDCYCRSIQPNQDVPGLGKAIASAFSVFKQAAHDLEACGLYIDRPEGWGFFYGKPSDGQFFSVPRASGDGHIVPISKRMKQSEDSYFRFVLTWIDGGGSKGWVTHYRAKHAPLSAEFAAAFHFLGGFSPFQECPEFDFDGCWWRFTPFFDDRDSGFGRSADHAHSSFDAHASHFSRGLEQLLAAHAEVEPYGMSFLSIQDPPIAARAHAPPAAPQTRPMERRSAPDGTDAYDVALSFAGTERAHAEELANRLRDAGFQVFYDGFYPEQLWGKDLASFFDRVYRKDSRFCVMFVSQEYAERMWTTHERRSAQARAVEEKGREYILPIRVDGTDLDGLPPTVGYLSLDEHSVEQIADILVNKLRNSR